MFLHHVLLAAIYPALRIMTIIRKNIFLKRDDRLRVLLYHDIPPAKRGQFSDQLRRLKQTWEFITPEEFEKIMSGDLPLRGRKLLLTFDDGFVSNREVADTVLKQLNIKALFFVVSDFIDLKDPAAARKFVADHIYPGLGQVPLHWTNMNWDDLRHLIAGGHTIGAHTKMHCRLSTITDPVVLHEEIVQSADKLEQQLAVPIRHFAFPFGNLASFSSQALQVAEGRFRFVHSGLRGNNSETISPYAIRRDSVTPADMNLLIGSFLEGGADFQYRNSREELDKWV
jgi:peptidoglycan/xylan/chitin deacetylase (PgdA/CDA1 family)